MCSVWRHRAFHSTEHEDNAICFNEQDSNNNISFCGATAPNGPGSPHCRGFTITLRHTAIGRTPLDESLTWLRTTHKKRQDIHAPAGIRTHIASRQAAAKPHPRPRGHWDRLSLRSCIIRILTKLYITSTFPTFMCCLFWYTGIVYFTIYRPKMYLLMLHMPFSI